jgi:acetyltransferase-like isoleucine patch superfamily enzyme
MAIPPDGFTVAQIGGRAMNAVREIGVRRASRFFFATLFQAGLNWMIFPPLRIFALRLVGAKIGTDSIVHHVHFFNAYRTGWRGMHLGARCFIGDECLLDLADQIVMADEVTLAERVTILTHTNVGYASHPLQPYLPAMQAPVHLERGAFVGVNATILPGITIGECAIVAAGSVVTENVPAWALVGGVPARFIRDVRQQRDVKDCG